MESVTGSGRTGRTPNKRDSERKTIFAESFLDFVRLREQLPELPNGYRLRPLMLNDYHHGYLELLSQLTAVGDVTEEMFLRRFDLMRNTSPPSYYIIVIEHTKARRIVGTATLVVEWKFIHEAGCRGRTEDVVVDQTVRGQHFGMILSQHIVALARHIGVYKLSLECKDELISFYEQFGFKKDENNFLVQKFY